jgi:hypothetical protein
LLGAETVNYLQDLRKYFTEKIASSKSKCISSIVDWKEQMRAALFLSNLTKEDVNWLEVEDEVYGPLDSDRHPTVEIGRQNKMKKTAAAYLHLPSFSVNTIFARFF